MTRDELISLIQQYKAKGLSSDPKELNDAMSAYWQAEAYLSSLEKEAIIMARDDVALEGNPEYFYRVCDMVVRSISSRIS